jgi:hypothetical protein
MARPDGRIAEFAGAGRDVLNEAMHREVAAAITEFVRSVTGPAAAEQPPASIGGVP